jgi:protoporphyrin/coproporphyrin ferrochelatase
MVFGKKGVLLVNLGTPNSPNRGDVYVYLRQFLTDPRVIDIPWLPRQLLVKGIIAPFRSGSSSKLYKELWTPEGSPIKIFGERVAATGGIGRRVHRGIGHALSKSVG